MSKLAELRRQQRGLLAQAKAIVDLAGREGRDFTGDERQQIDALLEAAENLKPEIARLENDPVEKQRAKAADDAAIRKALNDLVGDGSGEWFNAGGLGGPAGWRRRSEWGKAFMQALPYQPASGRKDLMPPTGSVTVGSPLTTIGTLGDLGRAETLLQFIPREQIGEDNVSYLAETERTHEAAPVAAGEAKPVSTYKLERKDDRVRVIAHLTEPINRFWLADAPLLKSYIDGVLREGLMLELEYQIIQGDGTGENFLGILNWPGILAEPFAVDAITTCRRAITALELYSITPSGFVLHPADWETIELAYDEGVYQMTSSEAQPPVDRARRRLWGLPVALSTNCPEGVGILADWANAVHLWECGAVRIDWSESVTIPSTEYDADKEFYSAFETNQVVFRAELRAILGVPRANGIVEIDLLAGS
jgi:HK97 family phage major capsid protein